MTKNDFPEKLLYYSKIDKYCVDVILRNTFVVTDPIRGFNDPLDCFFEYTFNRMQKEDIVAALRGLFIVENYHIKNVEEVGDLSDADRKIIDTYLDKLTRCTEDILKRRLSELGTKETRNKFSKILRIRSFSAQTVDRTLNNIMFSHYGDSHKGLCYIFNSVKLITNDLMSSFLKVNYSPEPASIEYKSPEEYSDNELEQMGRDMISIKHEDWEYEKEWRLMKVLTDPSENINDIWEFEPDALEGIVLGVKTTTEDEERIIKLVEKRPAKVNIYKARRKYGSFCLEYVNNKIN